MCLLQLIKIISVIKFNKVTFIIIVIIIKLDLKSLNLVIFLQTRIHPLLLIVNKYYFTLNFHHLFHNLLTIIFDQINLLDLDQHTAINQSSNFLFNFIINFNLA